MKGSLLVPDTGPEPDLDLSDQEEEKQNDEMWTQSEPQSSSSKSSMSVSTKVVAGPPFGTHPIIRCAHQPSAAPSSILLPIVNFHRHVTLLPSVVVVIVAIVVVVLVMITTDVPVRFFVCGCVVEVVLTYGLTHHSSTRQPFFGGSRWPPYVCSWRPFRCTSTP
jgi:hypothetical protein